MSLYPPVVGHVSDDETSPAKADRDEQEHGHVMADAVIFTIHKVVAVGHPVLRKHKKHET